MSDSHKKSASEVMHQQETLVDALRFYACQGNWGRVASYSDGFWYMNGRPWMRAYAALKDAGWGVELTGRGQDEEEDEADQLAIMERRLREAESRLSNETSKAERYAGFLIQIAESIEEPFYADQRERTGVAVDCRTALEGAEPYAAERKLIERIVELERELAEERACLAQAVKLQNQAHDASVEERKHRKAAEAGEHEEIEKRLKAERELTEARAEREAWKEAAQRRGKSTMPEIVELRTYAELVTAAARRAVSDMDAIILGSEHIALEDTADALRGAIGDGEPRESHEIGRLQEE